jgi:hypothetical protein
VRPATRRYQRPKFSTRSTHVACDNCKRSRIGERSAGLGPARVSPAFSARIGPAGRLVHLLSACAPLLGATFFFCRGALQRRDIAKHGRCSVEPWRVAGRWGPLGVAAYDAGCGRGARRDSGSRARAGRTLLQGSCQVTFGRARDEVWDAVSDRRQLRIRRWRRASRVPRTVPPVRCIACGQRSTGPMFGGRVGQRKRCRCYCIRLSQDQR